MTDSYSKLKDLYFILYFEPFREIIDNHLSYLHYDTPKLTFYHVSIKALSNDLSPLKSRAISL